jgi:threonine aldolase
MHTASEADQPIGERELSRLRWRCRRGLLENDLFIELGVASNSAARSLFEQVHDIEMLQLSTAPAVNSIYPVLDPAVSKPLQDWSFFWDWDAASHQFRWMTAWDVDLSDISAFVSGLRSLLD